jgi:hypothetical protein
MDTWMMNNFSHYLNTTTTATMCISMNAYVKARPLT